MNVNSISKPNSTSYQSNNLFGIMVRVLENLDQMLLCCFVTHEYNMDSKQHH
jgi:hypothetical protein